MVFAVWIICGSFCFSGFFMFWKYAPENERVAVMQNAWTVLATKLKFRDPSRLISCKTMVIWVYHPGLAGLMLVGFGFILPWWCFEGEKMRFGNDRSSMQEPLKKKIPVIQKLQKLVSWQIWNQRFYRWQILWAKCPLQLMITVWWDILIWRTDIFAPPPRSLLNPCTDTIPTTLAFLSWSSGRVLLERTNIAFEYSLERLRNANKNGLSMVSLAGYLYQGTTEQKIIYSGKDGLVAMDPRALQEN